MSNSKLEERFLTLLTELAPTLTVVREFMAIEGRRFRFDFYIPSAELLIEIQGGTFTGGRHTRGVGMAADAEKSRLAQMQGYQVFAYTGQQITKAAIVELLKYVVEREKLVNKQRKPNTKKKPEYNNGRKKANVRKPN